jgi:hypothetical protein
MSETNNTQTTNPNKFRSPVLWLISSIAHRFKSKTHVTDEEWQDIFTEALMREKNTGGIYTEADLRKAIYMAANSETENVAIRAAEIIGEISQSKSNEKSN